MSLLLAFSIVLGMLQLPSMPVVADAEQAQMVYHDLDFKDTVDMNSVLPIVASGNTCDVTEDPENGNKYLKLVNNAGGNTKALINNNGKILSGNVIFRMDVASTNLGSAQIKIMGANGTITAEELVHHKSLIDTNSLDI